MNPQLEKWVSGVWGPKITSQLICFLRNQIHYIYMIYSESVTGIQYWWPFSRPHPHLLSVPVKVLGTENTKTILQKLFCVFSSRSLHAQLAPDRIGARNAGYSWSWLWQRHQPSMNMIKWTTFQPRSAWSWWMKENLPRCEWYSKKNTWMSCLDLVLALSLTGHMTLNKSLFPPESSFLVCKINRLDQVITRNIWGA